MSKYLEDLEDIQRPKIPKEKPKENKHKTTPKVLKLASSVKEGNTTKSSRLVDTLLSKFENFILNFDQETEGSFENEDEKRVI